MTGRELMTLRNLDEFTGDGFTIQSGSKDIGVYSGCLGSLRRRGLTDRTPRGWIVTDSGRAVLRMLGNYTEPYKRW